MSNTTLQLIQINLDKIAALRNAGIEPYPYSYSVSHALTDIRSQAEILVMEQTTVTIASRVMAQRSAGNKLRFLDLAATIEQIRTAQHIQIMVRRNDVDDATWLVIENLSLGDWIGIEGQCIITNTGELTVQAQKVVMLCKVLRPIPFPKIYRSTPQETREAFTLQDAEVLWQQPELDMLIRRKADVLVARHLILSATRRILTDTFNCIEIETPFLNIHFGGAEATPFTTHINALSQEVYLAISPEIELKRAIVGGIGSGGALGKGAYFIARNFRNEGVDRTHNPEFTSMEVYIPFVDYEFMMDVTEEIFREACLAVHGTMRCSYQGIKLDFGKAWPRYEMVQLVSDYSGIDVAQWDVKTIRSAMAMRGLHKAYTLDGLEGEALLSILINAGLAHHYAEIEGIDSTELQTIILRHKLHNALDLDQEWDYLVLDLFDIYCEPFLLEPCHVILHPARSTPLCKEYRHGALPNGQRIIERFESFGVGMELSNAYSELNEPITQRQLVEEQVQARLEGNEEAMPHNELFLQAIEMGMPPCGGLGIGIDRMVMLLTDSSTIRNVIAFPMVGKKDA